MNRLAINGGKPVRDTRLYYGKQSMNDEDIQAVIAALKGDLLTTGPTVGEFEDRIKEYVGAEYAAVVSNGTAALHIACLAAGIEKGDEVITSPMTFAASANCVLYCGGTPVFADIDPLTYNIDPDEIEKKITSKTKAIIPVDYTGQPADMDRIRAVADKYGLLIIEDGAHALGSEYKNKKAGTSADMTMFSFHPVKPITTMEGGAITTNNENLYKRLLMFKSHGITRDENLLTKNDGLWYYEQQSLGYNYRLTDVQCALGISQIKRIDSFIGRRREIAQRYNEAFKDLAGITIPYQAVYSNSGWHLYVIKIDTERLNCGRKEFFDALYAENLGINVHYIPVYYHPYYRSLGYQKGLCPIAEDLYEKILTLPLFPKMTDSDAEDVIEAVNKVVKFYREKVVS